MIDPALTLIRAKVHVFGLTFVATIRQAKLLTDAGYARPITPPEGKRRKPGCLWMQVTRAGKKVVAYRTDR